MAGWIIFLVRPGSSSEMSMRRAVSFEITSSKINSHLASAIE
jgi:hypothetical protein